MTWTDYAQEVRRTLPDMGNDAMVHHAMVHHAKLGLIAEIGEVHALYQKTYQGKPLVVERLLDELGDVAWFATELALGFDVTLEWPEFQESNADVPALLSALSWTAGIISLQGATNTDLLRLELNNILEYVAKLAWDYGHDMRDVIARNVSKLRERYPNGFEVR